MSLTEEQKRKCSEAVPGTVPLCGEVSCHPIVAEGHGEVSEEPSAAPIFFLEPGEPGEPGRVISIGTELVYNLQVEINVNYHLFTRVLSAN